MRIENEFCQGQVLAPEQPVIICLHGFMGSHTDWHPVINQLPANLKENVLYLNLPLNYPEHINDIAAYSAWLWHQLADLSQPFVLIGYSLGSRIAMHWLNDYPEKIIAGVLEAGHPGLLGDNDRLQSDKLWQQRFVTQPLKQTLEQWYQQAVFSDSDRGKTAAILRQYSGEERALGRMIADLSVARQSDLSPVLGKHPLLYLCGENDSKYQSVARQLVSQHTNILHHSIPGAGHNCHLHNPGAVAVLVTQFLSKVF